MEKIFDTILKSLQTCFPEGPLWSGVYTGNLAKRLQVYSDQIVKLYEDFRKIRTNFFPYSTERVEDWGKVYQFDNLLKKLLTQTDPDIIQEKNDQIRRYMQVVRWRDYVSYTINGIQQILDDLDFGGVKVRYLDTNPTNLILADTGKAVMGRSSAIMGGENVNMGASSYAETFFYIAREKQYDLDKTTQTPSNPKYFPLIFLLCGDDPYKDQPNIFVGDIARYPAATVDSYRKDEFIKLILKIKPMFMWALVRIVWK